MFQWLHKIGPGFVILLSVGTFFIGFLLQLLVTIGLPNIRNIYFLGYTLSDLGQQTRIGLWTICTDQYLSSVFFGTDSGETCQTKTLGYEDSRYGVIADYLLIHSLSKALVVQPISCAFAGLAILSAFLHIFTNFIVWPFIGALAGVFVILSFVFEIILFSVARSRLSNKQAVANLGSGIESVGFGPAIWLQLVALIVVCFAVFAQWTAFTRRKLRKTHGVGTMGKRDSASIRSYRASVAGSDAGSLRNAPPPSSRTHKKKQSTVPTASTPASEEIALKDMPAPIATAAAPAGERNYASTRRKRVPQYDHVDDEEDQATTARAPRRSSVSANDVYEDATDVGVADEDTGRDDNDDTVQHILGARARSRPSTSTSASSQSIQHREPLQEMQDTIVSPRRGKRAARYSARMAEE